jgi:hypothetical protein
VQVCDVVRVYRNISVVVMEGCRVVEGAWPTTPGPLLYWALLALFIATVLFVAELTGLCTTIQRRLCRRNNSWVDFV